MKKYLLFISLLCCLGADVMAQPATYAIPFSIGRNNCGSTSGATVLYRFSGSGTRAYNYDSTYFFSYVSPNLSRNSLINAYFPRLRVGNSTYTSTLPSTFTARDRFSTSAASVSFNPKDGKLYYLWTDYSNDVSATLKTYVWRWNPDTTFSTASFNSPPPVILLDTLCSFVFDIGGITFDNSGNAWQLEFSNPPAPYKSRMRKIDFVTKVIDPIPDTLDLVPGAGGIGDTMFNVASGDITLMPNGQMYYVFDNKLYTPDYGSYGSATHHISSTYIDTIRRPAGATNLVGLAYGNGDLISSFSPGCIYRKIDPITGDTNFVNYTYLAAKGVASSDMSQISAGLGVAKRLVSVTPTGTAGQYNVVYDVLIKNYGTTPLTNLQVYDSLSFINGAANLSNVSTTMMTVPPPPGIALNAGFNGVTDARLLQFSGQNLPNFPVDSSSFTVRINCRISNVLDGVVYNNSAVGYATGYKGVALRDSSTNGSVPDLNQNDKPDDFGEGQPTPFVIIITPTTPPCSALSQVLYTNTFGTGVGLSASLPASPSISTQYTATGTAPVGTNRFSTTNNASLGDPTNWISLADHTGDPNGRMMVVNADAPSYVFYRDTLPVACPGQQYSMSFWTAFIGNSTYQSTCNALGGFKYPKFLIRMRDLLTGLTITQFTTANITSTSWQQLGMKWVMPAGYTNIIMELLNAGPGGCGNDFALDDVQYGICDPAPTVSAASSCFGGTATFTSALSDPTVIPGSKSYQWQVAPALAGPYVNIIGATASTYTINPILASDTGKYYRVIIAAAGNIAIPSCQYISPGIKLTSAISSVGPSSISAPSTTFCNPGSVTLTAVGGTLGTSANYQWGTGSVVGTSPIVGATSSTLTVSPTVTTTYWVRIENTAGPCTSTTGGTTVTITVIQPSAAPTSITGPDICNGSSTTLTAVGGTLGTSANYQWGTGAVVGTSPIAGATSPTLTVSPSATTTYWVRIENTTSPCSATTGGVTKVVTVSQPSVGPTSITAPSSTICNGSSVTLTAVGGTLGTSANYQWGTGSVVGTSPIGGATSSTLTVSPTTTTTYWVRIENTASPCTATTGGTTVTVTVNQPSAAPTSVTGADICNGGSTTLTAFGGTLGTSANYQWGTGAVVGTSPIGGATSSTLTVSPSVTTTYWVRIENTAGPCAATTSGLTKTITVSQPSAAPTSVTGADICNGGSTTLTAVGGTLGTSANYQWGTGAVVGTSPIVGATSSTLTVSPSVTTTYWVRIENTSSPCTATTSGLTKTITVSQPSAAPTSVTGADICNGGSTTLTAVGGTLGTSANYQWGTGAVVGTSPIAGATSSTLTVSPSVTTTYWVRIENTSSPCTATTSGLTKTITVSQPSVAPTSVTGANICNGSSTTLTAVGGTLGTSANYQWGTGAVVGTSPIVGATSSTLTVSPTTTTTYWVRIENTAGPCTATTSGLTKVITVTQPSTAPSNITGPDICNSGSTTLTANGGALGTSANYQWGTGSVVGTNPIVGATGSTLTVSPASTTTYWVRIENTAGPCTPTTSGVTKLVTVSFSSTAPSSITGADFCNPGSTTLTALGGALGTSANYQWGTGAVVGTNPIVGATSSTLTVSPAVTTTYWVRIENNAAPCTATTGGVTKTITVSQPSVAPTAANKNKNNICPGISAKIFRTGGSLGTTATWKWYTGSPGGTLIGSGDTLTVTPLVTTTYYVRAEGFCNTTAAQSVTIFISCDIDKDKDGIPDYIESNIPAAVANGYNTGYPGYVDYNNDFINDNFEADGDSDNDGNPNYLDTDYPGRVDSNSDGIDDRFDTDLDGVINMLDLDSDNDGIPDVVEAYGVDADGNGKIDNFTDTDGDGLSQNVDANNTGANNSSIGLGVPDLDADGVPNFLDLDSDNDGIPDIVEAGAPDTNNNGKVDGFTDVNGDGLHDSYINAGALIITGADGNNDGKADTWPNKNMDRDLRPNAYDMDSDGDGIVDVIEAGLPDANFDGKVDGVIAANGWSTTVSAMPTLTVRSTDADGKPDYLDIDADDDGIPDNIEGQTTTGYKLPLLTDADGDGLALPYDNLPAAFGGSGILVYDHDGDGTPDYRDLDTDADGLSDRVEGNDFNLNGIPDDNVTLTGLDTDGDGLDNRFDSLTSVTNIKGTSYRMGAGGSFTGDPTPGSRTTVQKTWAYQTDRDWRYSGYVLPVKFLNLTGVLQAQKVLLSWKVIADKEVDHFEVERSINNTTFTKTGTVTKTIRLNTIEDLAFTDDVSNVNSDVIYYRIKVIGKAGEVQYSNILVIRKQLNKTGLSIAPNPAKDNVSISFFAEKESVVTIRLIDDNGKLVLLKDQKVSKGNNTIQLTGLDRYSSGIYVIQVYVNSEVVSQKLVLIK